MRLHVVAGPKDACLNVARAYDAIADEYDAQVQGDDWMRRALRAHFDRLFRAGDRVLDVGCGTGIDAIALARRGVRVVGIDASEAMIAQLRLKALATPGAAGHIDAQVLSVQELGRLEEEPFDGLISAFASLSTLPDLALFADDAARLVRPKGRMVLHMLNRFSLWEWLGYVMRGDWSAARRVGRVRTRSFTIGGLALSHSLYYPGEAYHRFFSRGFRLREKYSLGALRPPHTVRRMPASLVRALERLDVRTSGWPLLENAGRFFVLDLERMAD